MKRVLLVPDVRGWAWWWMSLGIQRYANADRYAVDVIDQTQFGVLTKLPHTLGCWDAILQWSWVESSNRPEIRRSCSVLASHGAEYPYPATDPDLVPARIATALRNRGKAAQSLPAFASILCVSPALHGVALDCGANAVLTLPGVDHKAFKVGKHRRDGALRVGWCGQPAGTTKGYSEILLPLMARSGPEVEFRINDRHAGNAASQGEMADWYRSLDLLLTTSCSEGFQMPPLEAMACGRPVMATRCGGIEMLVEDGVTGWLVDGWSRESEAAGIVAALDRKLKSLSRDAVRGAGLAARDAVESRFSWERRAKDWLMAICGESE